MSSAIVVTPILLNSSVSGTALLAGTVAGTAAVVLAPIAVGMLLSGVAHAVERFQEGQRQACAHAVEQELSAIFDRVRNELDRAPVSERARRKLRLDLVELDARRQRLGLSLESGALTPSDAEDFRNELERFSQEVTRQESHLLETREKRGFLLQRVTGACERYRRLGITWSADLFVEAQATAEKLGRSDAADPDQELDMLARLAGKLESALESAVAANLEARGTIGKGAAAASLPSAGPSAEDRRREAERARIEDSRNEIRFYLQRLGAEAPESVDDTLAGLGGEAELCLDLGRLEAIRDQFQLTWQKIHGERSLSLFFARRLAALRSVLPADSPLGNDISATLEGGRITRDAHARFVLAVERSLAEEKVRADRSRLEEHLRSQLAAHGVVMLDRAEEGDLSRRLATGRGVLLPTRHEGCHVLLRLSREGELTVRMLRLVADEREKQGITDHMRLRDREIKTDWCRHLDLLLEDLVGARIFTLEQVRVEADLEYVTIEQMAAAGVDVSGVRNRPDGRPDDAGTGAEGTARGRSKGDRS